jgi:hypothetical protein
MPGNFPTMRIAIVSLMALAAGANAFAQPAAAPADPTPAQSAPTPPTADTTAPATPAPATPAAPTPAAATPAAPAAAPTPAPVAAAPTPPAAATPAPSPAPAPPAATATTAPATDAPAAPTTPPAPGATPPAAVAAEAPPAAPTPPPPPAPPTDPTAIAVLAVLQKVCIPAANGGNFMQLAKGYGLRKNGDNNWVLKQRDFTLLVEDPGSNPTQCHVDVTHPLDADSPGKPIVVALNDWAAVENGWSLYRNDKSVQAGMLVTTRSWTLDWNGKAQGLVFTNMRKPDGTPLHNGVDTSQVIYSVLPSTSS